ncbi:MAG: 7-cyano-7-deazaguanine synthase QueC [Halorhodospira halophila]|uniref:7-cyano-7-deazaguanine synthase QueC n=1 Tax=Halorhodospira TaxID=85108 RepID=UPI0019141879|nr:MULTISPECIES: 7-cyano-7-deazaguanine synthase QueC [Halorhodospira]MBK5936275.1 7-cyano-7-deazaguanine synthase QueC [Halorhodospira halophila]MBK5944133.1 7-cyano-7-deazaguanine synthase QueC [Halorhodospira halophila]MCC3749832.1 7-cyano-7-deazaguanine synthase QueC [Halorhodospira halophila]MCG5532744.1 7-cyano-7-deazaguanine synthase QueC [Halorhodospira sp. 9621]MCG5537077.1 7-cyano-7-deazaguanine synthase QueC [Halorhodospira sp. 9622]
MAESRQRTPASTDEEHALVLFSGGQDSTACLAWALERFSRVETIGFAYGQRHDVELSARREVLDGLRALRPDWAARLGEDRVLDAGVLGEISDTALTREAEITYDARGLPNTFVPGRNLLFFTLAAALGHRRGIRHLVAGVCETDFSGYPDCRDDTVKSLQVTLNLGMAERLVLHTPLMWLDKAQTWALTERLGGTALVDLIVEASHTCYYGAREQRHEWGYGCGECPACRLRAEGWHRYRDSSAAP